MLNSHFLIGFADELTLEKEAGLFSPVAKGTTALGKKVRGMMTRAYKRGMTQRFRMKKKAQTELPKAPQAGSSSGVKVPQPPKAQPMPAKKPKTWTSAPNDATKGLPMPARGQQMQPMGKLGAVRESVLRKLSGVPPVSEGAGRAVKNVLDQATPSSQARRVPHGDVLEFGANDPRYGGGLGNFGGKKAPKFTNKVNPTDTPQAFGTGCGMGKKALSMSTAKTLLAGGAGAAGLYGLSKLLKNAPKKVDQAQDKRRDRLRSMNF